MDASRLAGMAEVATGVLHNVGNVLNSVNISATLLMERARHSRIDRVAKLAELLRTHESDLATFLIQDAQGRQIPAFMDKLATHLAGEQGDMLDELKSLQKNIDHIKDVIAMQQSYSRISGVMETVGVSELVEDALTINAEALVRHRVAVDRDYRAQPAITVEKHKVLQILVNLIRNAKYACDDSGRDDKRITVKISADHERTAITVSDNGIGIPQENLARIFAHGFTTRRNGHGFGLHNSANAAHELGGGLTASSAGPGFGASFILELPLRSATPNP